MNFGELEATLLCSSARVEVRVRRSHSGGVRTTTTQSRLFSPAELISMGEPTTEGHWAGLEYHRRKKVMEREKFIEEVLQFWTSAIANVAGNTPNPPVSTTWRGIDSIRTVLRPFMAENRNHAHLPTGGGMDMRSVDDSVEPGCLEFGIGERVAWVLKPESLTLEYFLESPIESFLLLELAALLPSGTNGQRRAENEELVELGRGNYVERSVWDNGFLGYDEGGREIPLPDESRLVIRWLKGKILIVAKGSLWNGIPATYDGRHNAMKAIDIRRFIIKGLGGGEA